MKVKVILVAGTSFFEVIVHATDYESARRTAENQNPEARVIAIEPAYTDLNLETNSDHLIC